LTTVAHAYADDLTAARALDADLATAPALDDRARTHLRRRHGVRRADAGLAYLRGRGVRDEVLGPALVGWCEGDRLATLAAWHGWPEAELVDLGLLDGGGRERLAGRVVVPERRQVYGFGRSPIAHDPAARCVWLVGRSIDANQANAPKYLGIRAPRRALGLEQAAGHERLMLVDGVIDYLVGLSWGLPVLALGGLGLRPDDLIAVRHVREIVLLLDADRAGQAEARRLAAQIGPRARVVPPPSPAKDLADLALLPDGRSRLVAALSRYGAAAMKESRHAPIIP
jgi:DNA primase